MNLNSIEKVALKAYNGLRSFYNPIKYYASLKASGFLANFFAEGGVSLHLPVFKRYDLIFNDRRKYLEKSFTFHSRTNAEVLLRKTIFELSESEYIDPTKSVIDIGSWLADNALVWARIRPNSRIYAIDPSRSNLEFGKKLATINGIDNIEWIEAVCSDEPNVPLIINEGDIHHGSFTVGSSRSEVEFVSTTLDTLVPSTEHDQIGFLHVDVEGFEEKVLLGAKNIICESRPVIVFEQHISSEDPSAIISFLEAYNYVVFMINEVLPGCSLDCRNLIALRADRPLPTLSSRRQFEGRFESVWYATYGNSMIRIR